MSDVHRRRTTDGGESGSRSQRGVEKAVAAGHSDLNGLAGEAIKRTAELASAGELTRDKSRSAYTCTPNLGPLYSTTVRETDLRSDPIFLQLRHCWQPHCSRPGHSSSSNCSLGSSPSPSTRPSSGSPPPKFSEQPPSNSTSLDQRSSSSHARESAGPSSAADLPPRRRPHPPTVNGRSTCRSSPSHSSSPSRRCCSLHTSTRHQHLRRISRTSWPRSASILRATCSNSFRSRTTSSSNRISTSRFACKRRERQ